LHSPYADNPKLSTPFVNGLPTQLTHHQSNLHSQLALLSRAVKHVDSAHLELLAMAIRWFGLVIVYFTNIPLAKPENRNKGILLQERMNGDEIRGCTRG
jgi:hypothetical protein